MSFINLDDVEAQLRSQGLVLDKDLRFDASYQRWKIEGEDNEKRGWSRLSEWTNNLGHTYIVGVYGVFQGSEDGKTKIELPRRDGSSRPTLSDADVAALREAQRVALQRLAEKRKAEAKTAAQWAAIVWAKCAPCTEHEYTTRKGIAAHGLRVLGDTADIALPGVDESNFYRLKKAVGALVVPMHDAHGNVCGIQFIYPRGHERIKKSDKEFWPSGMAMGGTFGVIGPINRTGVLLVGEGFATMASLHEASGQSVAYAFSANNLGKAAKLLRKVNPRLKLLFCADDDYKTEGNPGVTAAVQATAELENCAWLKPDFTAEDGSDRRNDKKLTDFNDLLQLTGVPLTLANQINAKLDALKWRDTQPTRGGDSDGGAGDGQDKRRRAMSVMALDDVVARFIPLDDGTGKSVFDTWTNKIALRDQMISLLPAGMRSDDLKRHPVYIQRGAFYLDQVGFDPSGNDSGVKLNTWQGWPMLPKAGCCDKLLDLLCYLCSDDPNGDTVLRWLLCWMAYPLQNPGAKMASAVIMHGPQGTGKSTIFQSLAKIYGDYATVLNQRGLEDKFNSDWSDSKLLILAEEVVTRAEMWHIKNELKELVTGEWIRINPKNIAAYRQRNQVNIVYLSNENQPLPLDNDDRRHLVVYTPPALSEAYYDDVFLELENGGVEAFYYYLMNLDLTGFHPKKRPPMTEAKVALMALASPSEVRFVNDFITGDAGLPICPCLANDFYAAYMKWCRLNGEQRPRPSNQFHGAVSRLSGWEKKKCRVYENQDYLGDTIPKPLIIPPAHVLEAAGSAMPPGTSPTKWLTDSIFQFASQSKDEYPPVRRVA